MRKGFGHETYVEEDKQTKNVQKERCLNNKPMTLQRNR